MRSWPLKSFSLRHCDHWNPHCDAGAAHGATRSYSRYLSGGVIGIVAPYKSAGHLYYRPQGMVSLYRYVLSRSSADACTFGRTHRQTIQDGLRNLRNRSTQAERVLALLIESGLAYLLSSVMLCAVLLLRIDSDSIT